MLNRNRPVAGRPPKPEAERVVGREVGLRAETWKALNNRRATSGTPVNELVRRAVTQYLGHGSTGVVDLPLRSTAPCGQWAEILEDQTETYALPAQIAEEWAVSERYDFILKTHGCSMLGAGIPEDAYLHMRKIEHKAPDTGDICAVTALLADGSVLGTVKRWEWGGQRGIVLRDGDRKAIDLPEGAIELKARSKWMGNLIGTVDFKGGTAAPEPTEPMIALSSIIRPEIREQFAAIMKELHETDPVEAVAFMLYELALRNPREVREIMRERQSKMMQKMGYTGPQATENANRANTEALARYQRKKDRQKE